MAYSNWGAFVYKDSARRTDREGVGVFNDDEKDEPTGLRIFANLIKASEKYGGGGESQPWHEHSHHAVLGDGPVRLAGYKYKPELYHLMADGTVVDVGLGRFETRRDEYADVLSVHGEYEGCRFSAVLDLATGNLIDLELVEADGSAWTARCGYEYGAGHMDADDA